MSRGAQNFKQCDVTRLVKGAEKGGMKVARVEVVNGKITAFAGNPETGETAIEPDNEWDDVK